MQDYVDELSQNHYQTFQDRFHPKYRGVILDGDKERSIRKRHLREKLRLQSFNIGLPVTT